MPLTVFVILLDPSGIVTETIFVFSVVSFLVTGCSAFLMLFQLAPSYGPLKYVE